MLPLDYTAVKFEIAELDTWVTAAKLGLGAPEVESDPNPAVPPLFHALQPIFIPCGFRC